MLRILLELSDLDKLIEAYNSDKRFVNFIVKEKKITMKLSDEAFGNLTYINDYNMCMEIDRVVGESCKIALLKAY